MIQFLQKSGIYKIINLVNNKIYIGSSINISVRITSHKNTLKNNKHCNHYLQRSYNKYGKENFKFELIEYCNEEDLSLKEEYYINKFNSNNKINGYNLESFLNGRKRHSEQSKLKIGNSHRGKTKIITQEWRDNISKATLGMKRSNETKNNIRLAKLGKKRKKFSDKWKENLSKSKSFHCDVYNLNRELILENVDSRVISKYLNCTTRTVLLSIQKKYKCKKHIIVKSGEKDLFRNTKEESNRRRVKVKLL